MDTRQADHAHISQHNHDIAGMVISLSLQQIDFSSFLDVCFDVGLLNNGIQVVENIQNVPDLNQCAKCRRSRPFGLIALPTYLLVARFDLSNCGAFFGILLRRFSFELVIGLELIEKFVDHVPEPFIRQLHRHFSMQNDVEELTVSIPRPRSIDQTRPQSGIEMTIVEFLKRIHSAGRTAQITIEPDRAGRRLCHCRRIQKSVRLEARQNL